MPDASHGWDAHLERKHDEHYGNEPTDEDMDRYIEWCADQGIPVDLNDIGDWLERQGEREFDADDVADLESARVAEQESRWGAGLDW